MKHFSRIAFHNANSGDLIELFNTTLNLQKVRFYQMFRIIHHKSVDGSKSLLQSAVP